MLAPFFIKFRYYVKNLLRACLVLSISIAEA